MEKAEFKAGQSIKVNTPTGIIEGSIFRVRDRLIDVEFNYKATFQNCATRHLHGFSQKTGQPPKYHRAWHEKISVVV